MAEESGIIAALTQQEIVTGDPDYAMRRIKETKFPTALGEDPRWVRFRTTPPRRVKYRPMLPAGNKDYSIQNAQTGATETISGDKTGAGCNLPAETINYGYDVHTSCLMGKAIEAGPWCVLDLVRKKAVVPLLEKLRVDMPRYAKEDFGRQLLRDVIQYSKWKFSVAEGFPMSTDQPYFPCVPTGGPSIGFFRKVENLVRGQGWAKGAETITIGGRVALQIRMSREAIEWAIQQRKKELGTVINTELYVDDKVLGKTVVYEGIQFIEAEMPTKGYIIQTDTNTFEFVEVDPYVITDADGEGFWVDVNEEFYNSHVTVGGVRYRMIELAFYIHPMAMERQAFGAIPAVPGKKFTRNFNFEVESVPDWELADRGCNKDLFFFAYRMLHSYAALPKNPELMGAIAFLAPTNAYTVSDPWVDVGAPAVEPLSLQALSNPRAKDCITCDPDLQDTAVDPTNPTCTDLAPANGVGVMRLRAVTYDVEENAGGITVIVDRISGNTGAASCKIDVLEGTATEPENWTKPTGTTGTTGVDTHFYKTLNWADGESGPKSLVIPIVAAVGDDDGKQFTAVISTATGATLGTQTTATVTILDDDNA
jgi:hypothetical protein